MINITVYVHCAVHIFESGVESRNTEHFLCFFIAVKSLRRGFGSLFLRPRLLALNIIEFEFVLYECKLFYLSTYVNKFQFKQILFLKQCLIYVTVAELVSLRRLGSTQKRTASALQD